MKRIATAALLACMLALTASPAVASHKTDHVPGPKAGKASKAKAYGKYCMGQSKKHVKGEKGTAFSRCVTAMAKVSRDETKKGQSAPRRACKDLSKKHAKGEKGTAFSRCVVNAQKLKRELREQEAVAANEEAAA